MKGYRKFLLGAGYMAGCFTLCAMGINKNSDLIGTAAMCSSIAPGLAVIIYGNVKEHMAANGHA